METNTEVRKGRRGDREMEEEEEEEKGRAGGEKDNETDVNKQGRKQTR